MIIMNNYDKIFLLILVSVSLLTISYYALCFDKVMVRTDLPSHVILSQTPGFPFSEPEDLSIPYFYPKILHTFIHFIHSVTGIGLLELWLTLSIVVLAAFLITVYWFISERASKKHALISVVIMLAFTHIYIHIISALYPYFLSMILVLFTINRMEKYGHSRWLSALMFGGGIFFLHRGVFLLWVALYLYYVVRQKRYIYLTPIFIGVLIMFSAFPLYMGYWDDTTRFISIGNFDVTHLANVGEEASLLFFLFFVLGARNAQDKPPEKIIISLAIIFLCISIFFKDTNYMDRIMLNFIILALPFVSRGFMNLYERGRKGILYLSAMVSFVWVVKTLSDLRVLDGDTNYFYALIPEGVLVSSMLMFIGYAIMDYRKHGDWKFSLMLCAAAVFWALFMVVPV